MGTFFSKLLDTSDFTRRWDCGNWDSFHGWLHIASDLAVFAALTVIPIVILFFVWRRKQNSQPVKSPILFWLICATIFACGVVHLIEATLFFTPIYWISGVFKLLTALASWATVIALIRVSPKVLNLPSSGHLNSQLQQETTSLRSTQSQLPAVLEELQNSHHLLDAVLQNIGAGIIAVDANGQPLVVNLAATEISGMKMGADFKGWLEGYDVFLNDGRTPCEESNLPLARAIRGEVFSEEYLNRNKKTLEETWIRLNASPFLLDSNQNSMGAVIVFDDITELRKKRDELREGRLEAQTRLSRTDRQLDRILNTITDVIWTSEVRDEKLEFKYISPAIERLTGRPPAELLGNSDAYLSCVYEEDKEKLSNYIKEFLQGNREFADTEYRLNHTDGSTRWIRSRVIRESKDGAFSFHGVITDIDKEKKTAKALFQAERLASLGTLSAGLAHEINNPLGAMMLTTESALRSLQSHGPVNEQVSRSLNKVMDQIDRCSSIVDGVLMFAKNETSKKSLHSMSAVARRARDMILFKAKPKKITVTLKESDSDLTAVVNMTEMEQVLVNLLSNAIDASPPASEIEIQIRQLNQEIEVSVHDDGSGMDDSMKKMAFDPFFTSKRESGGTGLGLSMCHTIISNHGGTIEIHNSEIKKGAELRFRIPITTNNQND